MQENELRKLHGGLRRKRRFTRKQRGGNLSSTLKHAAHKNYEKHTHDTTDKPVADSDTTVKTSDSSTSKSQDGGVIDKDDVEHFGKIQQLESQLTANKFKTYKKMENTYKQLLKLKSDELEKATESCLHKQLMHKEKNLNCEKSCLRHLQKADNPKIKCGCKSFPLPFNYKSC